LSAGDAELRIRIEFPDSVDYLWLLSKDTGAWTPVALGTDHALVLDLPGGTGELFAFEAMDADASGRIPDGSIAAPGDPLTLEKKGDGDLTLSWDLSCLVGDTDFGVYEGVLGSWGSHMWRQCTTQGLTTFTLHPGDGDRYYLVVPHNGTREGYYGAHSDGTARPPSSSPCLPWSFGGCE